MNYALAREMFHSGFPKEDWKSCGNKDIDCSVCLSESSWPTLEELIEACGEHFYGVFKLPNNNWGAWETDSQDESNEMFDGRTATEAVARLWLALNKPCAGCCACPHTK